MAKVVETIPWRERPFLPVTRIAELFGCSTSQVYAMHRQGRLELFKFAGKTVAKTPEVIKLLDTGIGPWKPDGRTAKATAARQRTADGWKRSNASDKQAGLNTTGSIIAGRDFTLAQSEELHAEAQRRGINIRTLVLEMFPDPNVPVPAGPLLNERAARGER